MCQSNSNSHLELQVSKRHAVVATAFWPNSTSSLAHSSKVNNGLCLTPFVALIFNDSPGDLVNYLSAPGKSPLSVEYVYIYLTLADAQIIAQTSTTRSQPLSIISTFTFPFHKCSAVCFKAHVLAIMSHSLPHSPKTPQRSRPSSALYVYMQEYNFKLSNMTFSNKPPLLSAHQGSGDTSRPEEMKLVGLSNYSTRYLYNMP